MKDKTTDYNGHWNEPIHFKWESGRHGEDSNELQIDSSFREFIRVKEKQEK